MIFREFRRIFTKSPVLVVLAFIVPIFVVAALVTGVQAPTPPPSVGAAELAFLEDRLDALRQMQNDDGGTLEELRKSFGDFKESLDFFWNRVADNNDYEDLLIAFEAARVDFNKFKTCADEGLDKILITPKDHSRFQTGIAELLKSIEEGNPSDFFSKCTATMNAYEDFGKVIPGILLSAKSMTFSEDQKGELSGVYDNYIQPNLDNKFLTDDIYRADYLSSCCEYLELNIKLMQSGVSQYYGFTDFSEAAAKDRLAVLRVLVERGETSFDYSAPYSFGAVLNKGVGTTQFDFVFNCLEIVSIPLIVFACFIVVYCIFDDIRKNTVYASLVSSQSRRKVITAKLLACTLAIAALILVFILLFYFTALVMTGGVSAPTVLTAFGGNAVFISPSLLLLFYVFSLFFKVLFFASITALFCINSESLNEVLIKSAVLVGLLIFLNLMFTVIFNLAFYQYLPLVALDFAGFLGVGFLMTHHVASGYIWFTLPVLILAWIMILAVTVRRFNKRDF